jgi:AraC family transcriptional regulator, positive regulator of tynA and feaB
MPVTAVRQPNESGYGRPELSDAATSMNESCWSTDGVPRSRVRDYWLEAVGRAINDVDIRIEDSGSFSASLRQRKLGPLALSHINVHGTQIVRRTRSIIARRDTALFSVIRMIAGQGWLRQCGREVTLDQDHCVLVDSREPYEIAIVGRGESLSIHMPATWLTKRFQDAQLAVAKPLLHSSPWVGRLVGLMSAAHMIRPDSVSADLFEQHFGTTLALAAGASIETTSPAPRNGFRALQLTLAELASVPNLHADEVASVHQISARHVHHIYAAHGTTFRCELIRLRLERARAMLLDERFRSVSVDEIGRRCGFSDSRHFRRRFSQHFSTSPAALRQ